VPRCSIIIENRPDRETVDHFDHRCRMAERCPGTGNSLDHRAPTGWNQSIPTGTSADITAFCQSQRHAVVGVLAGRRSSRQGVLEYLRIPTLRSGYSALRPQSEWRRPRLPCLNSKHREAVARRGFGLVPQPCCVDSLGARPLAGQCRNRPQHGLTSSPRGTRQVRSVGALVIRKIYDQLDLRQMHEGAVRALRDFGRRIEYPLSLLAWSAGVHRGGVH
jgi:hypothetical protein